MENFEFIEHTADTGLIAYGDTMAEAFTGAARGMFSIIAELDNVDDTKETYSVDVTADDIEELLFNWLNDLLFIFDRDQVIFKTFDIMEYDDYHIRATCHGEAVDRSRHELRTEVKSATYHMLEVDREKNRVQVIFDI